MPVKFFCHRPAFDTVYEVLKKNIRCKMCYRAFVWQFRDSNNQFTTLSRIVISHSSDDNAFRNLFAIMVPAVPQHSMSIRFIIFFNFVILEKYSKLFTIIDVCVMTHIIK